MATRVLYFNDAHEFSPIRDERGQRGGIARLKTVVARLLAETPGALVVFGGDLAGGSLFGSFYKGMPIVEAFNQLPVHLANFGQHDFDFGSTVTRELVAASSFQWFTSNLVDEQQQPFAGVPTTLVRKVGGLAIGFIGLTDNMDTAPRDGTFFQNDLLDSAAEAAARLKAQGVDVILVVSQTNRVVNTALLDRVGTVNGILTEEDSEYETHIYHHQDGRPMIHPRGNMGSLIELNIEKREGRIVLEPKIHEIDGTVPDHAAFVERQLDYQARLERDLAEELAVLNTDMDAGVNTDFKCRWGETNIGNLIADAFKAYENVDLAFMNGGGIRANTKAGPFTMKDALSILPFGNMVCVVEIDGKAVRAALAHGVTGVDRFLGRLLHVSGACYSYDYPTQRLLDVSVGNQSFCEQRRYRVAMPSFMFQGSGGFEMFSDGKLVQPLTEAKRDIDVFAAYCRRLGTLFPKLEGRIKVHNK